MATPGMGRGKEVAISFFPARMGHQRDASRVHHLLESLKKQRTGGHIEERVLERKRGSIIDASGQTSSWVERYTHL